MIQTNNIPDKKNIAIDLPPETNKHRIGFKTEDLDWLEEYRKTHQLDTLGEALNHLIGVYRAWQVDLFEKIDMRRIGDKK